MSTQIIEAKAPGGDAAHSKDGARGTQARRKARVGETVQYMPKTGDPAEKLCAAIVTEVNEKGTVGLYVLRPRYSSVQWEIDVAEGDKPGCFRFIGNAKA